MHFSSIRCVSRRLALLAVGFALFAGPAFGSEPSIAQARILWMGANSYEFHVTVSHVDDSWEHFLNRWEIIGAGGRVIATRVFRHPHIGEGYVSRSLRGVSIPDGNSTIIIRAHDMRHGYSADKLMTLPTKDHRDTGWK